MLLIDLFIAFFQIGLLSFGGGMAALPLIQSAIVEGHGWLTIAEFSDLLTMAEMTPGPIAINASTFVGTRLAGPTGAIVATLGCIAPSCIIISALAWFYFRYKDLRLMQGVLSGLRPAVVSLIATAGSAIVILAFWGEAGISSNLQDINWIAVVIFLAALFIQRKIKINPILIIIATGILGAFIYQ
ncbi:chromate transporter [Ignavigranum ruoffiae]|uniref:chromate transporter n=1 Tax=Ignavigranum ruoffiae TaxID=89093 RepID=UPI0024AC8ED9|nr:chromate transporter [Ignavigranum ruoffiae]